MESLLSAVPALSGAIEKGGIVAVLILVIVALGIDYVRVRKLSAKTFSQRDRWRLAYTIVKAAADQAGAKYDLRDLDDLVKEDGSPA